MVKRPDQRGESGFSLLEAILVIVLAALISTLLLPFLGRTSARNEAHARHSLSLSDAAGAEAIFRSLVRASVDGGVGGDGRVLTLRVSLGADTPCVQAGRERVVRLTLDAGALQCESEGRFRTLLTWDEGEGAWSYADTAGRWRSAWSGGSAPLVRFEVRGPGARGRAWVQQAPVYPPPEPRS